MQSRCASLSCEVEMQLYKAIVPSWLLVLSSTWTKWWILVGNLQTYLPHLYLTLIFSFFIVPFQHLFQCKCLHSHFVLDALSDIWRVITLTKYFHHYLSHSCAIVLSTHFEESFVCLIPLLSCASSKGVGDKPTLFLLLAFDRRYSFLCFRIRDVKPAM